MGIFGKLFGTSEKSDNSGVRVLSATFRLVPLPGAGVNDAQDRLVELSLRANDPHIWLRKMFVAMSMCFRAAMCCLPGPSARNPRCGALTGNISRREAFARFARERR